MNRFTAVVLCACLFSWAVVAALRDRDGTAAGEWMGKHIRDFRRGFEIAGIALERQVDNG